MIIGATFGEMIIPNESRVWLPFRDAIVVSKLMNGEMVLSDMWGIILRALLMMFMLIFSSYFLYQKKDVLSNVKK